MQNKISLCVQFLHEHRDMAGRLAVKRAGYEKEYPADGGNHTRGQIRQP